MSDAPNPGDPFEMLRKLWGPFGVPVPGMMMPTTDPAEIEKRIADLKSVENWLNVNLNVLRMTIQGLEMQKATLAAIASMQTPSTGGTASGAAGQSAAEAWWSALQQATAPGAKGGKRDE